MLIEGLKLYVSAGGKAPLESVTLHYVQGELRFTAHAYCAAYDGRELVSAKDLVNFYCTMHTLRPFIDHEEALHHIFVAEGEQRGRCLAALMDIADDEVDEGIPRTYPTDPGRIDLLLRIGARLYVQDSGKKRLDIVYDRGFYEGMRRFKNEWHLLASYRKRFHPEYLHGSHNGLHCIFMAEGRHVGKSLASLLMESVCTQSILDRLPVGCRLLVKENNLQMPVKLLEDGQFADDEGNSWKNEWYLVPSFRKRFKIAYSPVQPLSLLFVAEGKYKGCSLDQQMDWSLDDDLDLRLLEFYVEETGRPPMTLVTHDGSGFVHPAHGGTMTASALLRFYRGGDPSPSEPLRHIYVAKGTHKGLTLASLLATSKIPLGIPLQPPLTRTSLEAKIVAAKEELAELHLIQERVEELRLLTAELVEARKILAQIE